jgi:bile acid:Na+ symporter, BASS family
MNAQMAATIALPLALVIIMFGLGLSLTVQDFKRVISFPRPVLVGLFCQMILLPAFAFLLCYVFKLKPEFAIGLMVLAASPGGVSSNIYSHLSDGDVALNMTLTAINSVLAAVALPLFTTLAISSFAGQEQNIDLQFKKMIEVFLIVLVPAAIGMFIHKKSPEFSKKMEKPVKIFSIVVLALIIVASAAKEWKLLTEHLGEVGAAVLVFNLVSLAVGYFVPMMLKISRRQATAISMEIGIHNGTLALYMAISVLGSTAYAVPAAVYSVVMYFTASAFTYFLKKNSGPKEL